MIRLEGVQKVYEDGFQALKNINLEFNEGEINVLIGPSGCGKTTMMKLLNRLIDFTDGKVYIDDKDITKVNPIDLRRSIGYVIQHIGLFPHMTIYDNVAAVPKLLKWDKERVYKRVTELLDMVGLDPDTFKKRHPSELSGGQQQRIGVIRALAAEPSIILMDEPFSALDPISREQLQDELVRLQREINKTIIFVTHDMDEALKIADQIILMKDGEVVQKGSPNEILSHPANEFVEDFIGTDRLHRTTAMPAIEEVMSPKGITASLEEKLQLTIDRMSKNKVDSLVVVDNENKLKGHISIFTALHHIQEEKKVSDILEPVKYVVRKDVPFKDVLEHMNEQDLNEIPVVDNNQIYLGMITRKAVLRVMAELYGNNGNEGS
jgi:osmoprotectant transport system ATP-binding protein